jgi:hypothetical protein
MTSTFSMKFDVAWRVLPLGQAAIYAGQMPFYRSNFPVPVYPSIEAITKATAPLKWTEDPWNGKLDVVKHPTFLQEAIEKHPDYADDCDGFAAYWAVALRKSNLADECWFAYSLWAGDKPSGHAVCVFRTGQSWFYVGNWNRCVPIPIASKDAWVDDIAARMNIPATVAARYRASADPRDTMVLDEYVVVKW